MFGYLKLDENCPKNLEQLYKKNYCYLCRSLDKHYGIISRFILSYDVSLFLISVTKDTYLSDVPSVTCFNKEARVSYDYEHSKSIAALCLLLVYYKCEDDINDNNSFKAKFVKFLYGRKFKKAKKDFPLMDQILKEYHDKMNRLEHIDSKLEIMEEMFATMMVELAMKCFGLEDENRIKTLSYLAKWLYFIDALDDLDDDIKDDTFNYLKEWANSFSDLKYYHYDKVLDHINYLNKFKEDIVFDDDLNTLILKRMVNYTVSDTNFNVLTKRR